MSSNYLVNKPNGYPSKVYPNYFWHAETQEDYKRLLEAEENSIDKAVFFSTYIKISYDPNSEDYLLLDKEDKSKPDFLEFIESYGFIEDGNSEENVELDSEECDEFLAVLKNVKTAKGDALFAEALCLTLSEVLAKKAVDPITMDIISSKLFELPLFLRVLDNEAYCSIMSKIFNYYDKASEE